MAASAKILFCYFIVLIFSSSLIQARESKFFSKFTHFTTIKNDEKTQLSPTEAPTLAPVSSLAPAPTLSTTTFRGETELFDEEFDGGETYQKGSQSSNVYANNNNNYNHNGFKFESESHETANRNNYNGYTNRGYYNNNNGYELVSTSSSHEDPYQNKNYNSNGEGRIYSSDKTVNNGYTNNYYNNINNNNGYELVSTSSSHEDPYQNNNYNSNGDGRNYNRYEPVSTSSSQETAYQSNGYNGNINNNGYELVSTSSSYETENEKKNNGGRSSQRQGMSDTRFMEGGRYYYEARKENYYNPANAYKNQMNYGNSEFNTMGFENDQEVYDDSQEESMP